MVVRQNQINQNLPDAESVRTGIIEDLYRRNEDLMKSKDERLSILEQELSQYKTYELIQDEVCKELEVQYPEVESSAFSTMMLHHKGSPTDTMTMVYLDTKKTIRGTNLTKLESWLKLRLKTDKIKIVQQ